MAESVLKMFLCLTVTACVNFCEVICIMHDFSEQDFKNCSSKLLSFFKFFYVFQPLGVLVFKKST